MGLFGLFKKKQPEPVKAPAPAPVPQKKTEKHRVAGTSFHKDEIMEMAVKNSDYALSKKELIDEDLIGEKIYEYDFDAEKAELIPEPTNEHDPKAIKVVVDGNHIGYIKSGSCAHVHKLMDSDAIEKVDIIVRGGNYKYIADDSGYDEKPEYVLEKDKTELYAELTLTLK